ncbi:hypothetical protein K1T71_002246 [Dendrolimus kikuchii]|uniref:Uncharacterized protein n=1 Tax=Dendrolimus kikuchii TaxID=765133 RepID=A0ACC1DCR6_9NEOP|nr:hypothetical protein K1T71_002246 [Dendrolimus kikuchii]
MSNKVAIVTGSNKGIGFAIVKGLLNRYDGTVYLTSRNESNGKKAVAELNKLGLKPAYHQLDVADRESVKRFAEYLKKTHGGFDILINNAAIAAGSERQCNYEELKEIVDINYYSLLTIQELLFPLVRDNGRILNIASDCGHLSNLLNKHWIERLSKKDLTVEEVNEFVKWYLDGRKDGTFNLKDLREDGDVGSYRIAKMAVCALTFIQQKELAARNISVNCMHPGLVRTDMTYGAGFYSPDEAARTPLYLVLDAPDTLKGEYVWHDGQILDWYDYNADWWFKISTLND